VKTRRHFLKESAVLLGAASVWSACATGSDDPSGDVDVIVVGAGSSGCVLANRLSAGGTRRVLLVEAGGPADDPAIRTPGQWTTLIGSAYDWQYATAPEPGLNDRIVPWPRGKVVGGSSAINAMAYVRGHRLVFDRWADAVDPSWSYAEVLPIFRALEDNSRGATAYLGAGGPQAVSDTTDPHAGHTAFLTAAGERGFAASADWDFNGAQQEDGAGFYQKNIRAGQRHSAADAFLTPVLDRPNLTVWSGALVRRVIVEGGRAAGIECTRDGQTQVVRASAGVVLSAGAIDSPKLLMLSGIGPADALGALGIPVVVDAPGVGANLHDHPRLSLRWEGLTSLPPSSVSAGLFTRSAGTPGSAPPDIQFYVGRGIDQPDSFITLTLGLSAPHSRGLLTLRSADPADAPVIHANYFQDPRDLEAMLSGVRLAQQIGTAPAYSRLRGAPIEPAADATSDDALRAFIRRSAATIFHPVGTCRMGRDEASVVDPQLRVRGVDGLWVADASVMPEVVNSQTHAACLLIGEKAATSMLQNT